MQSRVTPELLAAVKRKKFGELSPNYNAHTVALAREAPIKKQPDSRLPQIYDSILEAIGNTPLVRLKRLERRYNLPFELLAKCEYLNPGGSTKDRIALSMVDAAAESGLIKPGDALIEGTSGNTALGLALVAAIKDYHAIIAMPTKMSTEKQNMIQALRAEVLRTPLVPWNHDDSHITLAYKLAKSLPNSIVLDQYKNKANPRAHYVGTGVEILHQMGHYEGKSTIDFFFGGAGTGGTISGIAQRLKEDAPNCKVIGVDPVGSSLAVPKELNTYKEGQAYFVEGIGYDFIPSCLNRELIDAWVKTDDAESFAMARELIAIEGLFVGGSSGAVLAAVLKYASKIPPNSRVVMLLPDFSQNYITKFISDEWMGARGFQPVVPMSDSRGLKVRDLLPLTAPPLVDQQTATLADVLQPVAKGPVMVAHQGQICGVVDPVDLLSVVTRDRRCPRYALNAPLKPYVNVDFLMFDLDVPVERVCLAVKLCRYCVITEVPLHEDDAKNTGKLDVSKAYILTAEQLLEKLA